MERLAYNVHHCPYFTLAECRNNQCKSSFRKQLVVSGRIVLADMLRSLDLRMHLCINGFLTIPNSMLYLIPRATNHRSSFRVRDVLHEWLPCHNKLAHAIQTLK